MSLMFRAANDVSLSLSVVRLLMALFSLSSCSTSSGNLQQLFNKALPALLRPTVCACS